MTVGCLRVKEHSPLRPSRKGGHVPGSAINRKSALNGTVEAKETKGDTQRSGNDGPDRGGRGRQTTPA